MRLSTKKPFNPLSINLPSTSPVTIYPQQVVFEDVSDSSCYEIDLFVRNESSEVQNLRIIGPKAGEFKIKTEQGFRKKLAQGLAWKIEVLFCGEKYKDKKIFEDKFTVAGDNFKQIVNLKALKPREILIIPQNFNAGRLLTSLENIRQIPIKNQGREAAILSCTCVHTSVIHPLKETIIEPGSTSTVEIRFRSKKVGYLREILKFSNGFECQLTGTFVEEAIELFGQDGDKLMMVDMGPVYIGEKVSQKMFFTNNSNKNIDTIFKTFNKNIQLSQIKVDHQRGNFIIRSRPEEYANQLKKSYSTVQTQRVKVDPFSELKNLVTVFKEPTKNDIKKFHCYVAGLLCEEIEEEPIIETLIINAFNYKPTFKVPIKFISLYPRLKVSKHVLEFQDVRQRMDVTKEITFYNDGERDIILSVDEPQQIKVEGETTIPGHRNKTFKISLRAVKAGKISETIKFKIFDGFAIEVKVFATCRGSSIRAKKINNLNSTRDMNSTVKMYETLAGCRDDFNNTKSINNQLFNRTDALAEVRTTRLKHILKEHIETDSSPRMKQPQLELIHANSVPKLFFPKKNILTKRIPQNPIKVLAKDCSKYTKSLSIDQLASIILKEKQLAFGNVFINTEVINTLTIVNKNIQPILFELDTEKNEVLAGTSTQATKVDGRSEQKLTVKFTPNQLGAICLPLTYIINRTYLFQIYITAYVTLINLQVSAKNIELTFPPYDMNFKKTKQIELTNKGNSIIKCLCKFQEGKHFFVNREQIQLKPSSKQKVTVTYMPVESDSDQQQRMDLDKFMVKVVGGAQNIIKCIGNVSNARMAIKQSQICCMWHLVSIPFTGKLNLKSLTKGQILYKIQIPSELSQVITFDKEVSLLMSEERKQIGYSIVSHNSKRISSAIIVHLRGGKSVRIPVQCMFISPEIQVSSQILDFGTIPIMGNNYHQTITLTNLHRSEIKLQLPKRVDCQDYLIDIKEIQKYRTEHNLPIDFRSKKKNTTLKEEAKEKKGNNNKVFRLQPNSDLNLQVKFIPRKLQDFSMKLPLILCGTGEHQVLPVPVTLKCTSIEPIVYLYPQKVSFETRIIGDGKSTFTKSFQIKNPHNCSIDWQIDSNQSWKNGNFSMNQTRGCLKAQAMTEVEVSFKPQHQGHFWQKMDVVLKEKKVSHISLQCQGFAIFPNLKFNCNEILMPVVPLKIQSKTIFTIENHGFEAITISKWKTTNTFPMVEIGVNFPEGRILSVAKKFLKVEVVCSAQLPISFTTMLQFYDEFGTKYEIALSCTFDNSLMTTYRFLQNQAGNVTYDKKEGTVKMLPCQWTSTQNQQTLGKEIAGCQFIKNWLNHQLNLGVKQFPQCIIQSQGQLFHRMVNRISGCDLIKRCQHSHSDTFYMGIYSYYCDAIKILKTQGAFLNQLRPQFLLAYKDYKALVSSKNLIIYNESTFKIVSMQAWTAIFYQLCKMFVLSQITQKTISKFSSFFPSLTSTIYTNSQLLVFRFLNAFTTDDPIFTFCDRIRLLEIIQLSLQQTLNIKLSNALFALKVSMVVMTPQMFINLVSKFMHQTLTEYGLSLFLSQGDLQNIGSKQLTLFIISFIGMLYHYANLSPVCFEPSIGDKVTKIIQIQNPVNRKAHYKVKLQGSEEFHFQQTEIALLPKSKGQIKVSYHCKHNKEQQAKLFLIPEKEDINSASIQPLAFKLSTSIVSKITLKKTQITAYLYQITNLTLEAQLPIDITQLAQFSVTIYNSDEQRPSFFCFQHLNRTLKNNHDRLDLKLVPLTLGPKFCRVTYKSSLFGQFNFQFSAKIEPPRIVKQIKLKQLKVNKEEILQLVLPKQNEQLFLAQKYLTDHHYRVSQHISQTKRTILNKYQVTIVESSYISVFEESAQLKKGDIDGKEALQIDLKCHFGKPFVEYSCTLMVKNQMAKDIRYYKLMTCVAMKPKIIEIQVKSKARQNATIKIPIKTAPCELTLENMTSCFNITNYSQQMPPNTQLVCIFSPEWMMHHQVILTTQNRQTLEQVIYHINLIGQEPQYFDNIKLCGSSFFTKQVKIPFNFNSSQSLTAVIQSNRIVLNENIRVSSQKKWVSATILPSNVEQKCSIKLMKEGSGQFYWAQISIVNDKVQNLKTITLEAVPNGNHQLIIPDLSLTKDHQIHCEAQQFFNYSILKQKTVGQLCLNFQPHKEMDINKKIHIINNQKEFQVQIKLKSPALAPISLPQIISQNMEVKTSTINVVNVSELKGTYKAKVEPQNIFSLDHWQFDIRGKEKKQLKVTFNPQCLQTKYKAVIKFESDTLPTYQYHFTAKSEFKPAQKTIECEYYSDRDTLSDIFFTNHFSTTQKFIIQSKFKNSPFQIVEPTQPYFTLQSGISKKIIIKVGQSSKNANENGKLTIRLGDKLWVYHILPLAIKNLSKKINWNCKARQCYYQNIQLSQDIRVKSIESSSQIDPYLTYTMEENSNTLKLKYVPMKPLNRGQYQILLITHTSKYVINCTSCVTPADFDDTIFIKTKEINETGCVSFKLTNTKKSSVPFKAYLLKGLIDLSVELEKNVLQSYGRIGTTIYIKFTSHVFNKRVEDELWVQTSEMLWRFKVVGLLSKKYALK